MNLRQKIRRGFAFAFLSAVGNRIVSFGGQIALLRVLQPVDFGAQAFGLLVVNSFGLLRSIGIGEAPIVRADADQRTSDTGFVMALCMGALLYAVVYAGAPLALLASESDPHVIVQVVRLLGLILLLQNCCQRPQCLARTGTGVSEAVCRQQHGQHPLRGRSRGAGAGRQWRLEFGMGTPGGRHRRRIAAWSYAPWRPRLQFSWEIAREVLPYGRFVTGAGLVSFLVVNLDDLLVARLGGSIFSDSTPPPTW